jgi:cell fate regulator YaaT (PSP1 superfamily)
MSGERERDALAFARDRARELELPIKVFRVEIADGDRAVFYLSGERRVDLKDLLSALAERFPEPFEVRQVGVRDEAKMLGGIGSCGRELCCSTFLPRFAPVTIRMAKDQHLALTPTRVSGQCGRLKCCLVYEHAQYLETAGAPSAPASDDGPPPRSEP